jgi:hypothetical protein
MTKLYLMLGFRDKTHLFVYFDENIEVPLMKIIRTEEEMKNLTKNYNCEIWIKYGLKDGQKQLVTLLPEIQ